MGYVVLLAPRFFDDACGDVELAAKRGISPGDFRGWPVGGGSDMIGQTFPVAASAPPAALKVSPLDAGPAGVFRDVLMFAAVLTDTLLAM